MTTARVWQSQLGPIEARVPGHKHAAVCLMAAAVAAGCRMRLENAPAIEDMRVLSRIIAELGGEARHDDTLLVVDAGAMSRSAVPGDLSQRVHGTLYLLPALLTRLGHVRFPGAGGCQIGHDGQHFFRPYAHVVSVLETFGAKLEVQGDGVIGRGRLRACEVDILDYSEDPSRFLGPLCTGATKAAILAALGVETGTTRILNPILRPEIEALVDTVRALGFRVCEEPGCMEITADHRQSDIRRPVLSDLSAIVTYVACAAYQGVPARIMDLTVEPARRWLEQEIEVLDGMGVRLRWSETDLEVTSPEQFAAIELDVQPEGFATDHQPFFALLCLKGDGPSVVRDQVWRQRFGYAEGLRTLGAQIKDLDDGIVIQPGQLRRGRQTVRGSDLRSATVLLLAALGVPEFTRVEGVEHLDRGYEDLVPTLRSCGARIDGDPLETGAAAESAGRD